MSAYQFELPQELYVDAMETAIERNCSLLNKDHRWHGDHSLTKVIVLGEDDDRKAVEWKLYTMLQECSNRIDTTLIHVVPTDVVSLLVRGSFTINAGRQPHGSGNARKWDG